ATFVARWRHEHPTSARREALLARVRRQQTFAPHLTPQRIELLAALYGPADASAAPSTPAQARSLTDLFVDYYHPAAPCPREVLAGVWARCADAGRAPGGCAAGLAAAEARVGPLRPPSGLARASGAAADGPAAR